MKKAAKKFFYLAHYYCTGRRQTLKQIWSSPFKFIAGSSMLGLELSSKSECSTFMRSSWQERFSSDEVNVNSTLNSCTPIYLCLVRNQLRKLTCNDRKWSRQLYYGWENADAMKSLCLQLWSVFIESFECRHSGGSLTLFEKSNAPYEPELSFLNLKLKTVDHNRTLLCTKLSI